MILFVAPPFAGHLDRMLPLALAAEQAGHAPHFVTCPSRVSSIEAMGLSAEAPASLQPGVLQAIAEGHGQIHRHPWRALAQLRENLALLPSLTRDLTLIAQRIGARLIVADSVALMAGPAARHCNLPWVTVIASPLAIEAPDGPPSFMGGLTPRGGVLGPLRDALIRRGQRVAKRGVFRLMGRDVRDLLPDLYRADGSEAIYSPDAILGFGMTELEFPRSWPSGFRMIGPLHGPKRQANPLPLPPEKRRVFVTLGTHLPWARPGWERDLLALAQERQDIHFTYTRGGQPGSMMPDLPNLLVVPFADYATEVPRHDAVIHHGGSGVTYAAIEAARPALVVPQDFDQFDYAARIDHYKLGIRRPDLQRAGSAIDHLLGGKWPNLRLFQTAARRYEPEACFLETIQALLA